MDENHVCLSSIVEHMEYHGIEGRMTKMLIKSSQRVGVITP